MDEALVQDAQDEVDHEHGGEEQHAQALDGRLEGLRRTLERRGERGGHPELALEAAYLLHRIAQRHAGLEVEGDGHGRQLAQVVDGERTHAARQLGYRVEGDELARGRADVEHAEGVGVVLVLRQELHHDPVLVGRRVDRRDLGRPIGVIEGALDLGGRHPHGGGAITVDLDENLGARHLQVRVDVEEAGEPADLVEKSRPVFGTTLVLLAPMEDMNESTYGCLSTMAAASCWCAFMLSNEMSWAPSVKAKICPVSSSGMKPFEITMKSPAVPTRVATKITSVTWGCRRTTWSVRR